MGIDLAILWTLLIAFGLVLALSAGPPAPRPGGGADARLYEAVIRDVAQGVPYHQAAAREQRRVRAPLRPVGRSRASTSYSRRPAPRKKSINGRVC